MPQFYQELLTALAGEVGIDASSLLATEEIIIDDLPIGLRLEGEGQQAEVFLCSLIAPSNAVRWAETARALLLANHLWTGTGGATLGMLPESDMLTLSMRQPLRDLNADKLAVMLAKTADIGLAWQEFIAQSQIIPGASALLDATVDMPV